MNDTSREGGCLCGAVRYTVAWPPLMMLTCSCSNCQKQSGSALSVVGACRRGDLAIEGELTTFDDRGDSGNAVYRKFCGKCGSPVLTDTPGAQAQDLIFFKAGTLDQTAGLAPTPHMWTKSAQQWVVFPEGAVTLPEQ